VLTAFTSGWQVLLARGIACVLLGMVALIWPGITLFTLIVLFGAFTAADGLAAIWLGFSTRSTGRVWWEMVLLGVCVLTAGLAAVALPGLTTVIVVYVIAISAIVRGVLEIAADIQLRKVIDDEWVLIISGALSILFGVVLFARPGEGAVAMVLLIGAWMIAIGSMFIGLALRLRGVSERLKSSVAGLPRV